MILWLLFAVAVAFTVVTLAAYAFGKYWLGWTRFREHLRSIRWSAYAGAPDMWNWGIGFSAYGNFDPGFHFTSAGMMLRLGPFTAGWNADDTN